MKVVSKTNRIKLPKVKLNDGSLAEYKILQDYSGSDFSVTNENGFVRQDIYKEYEIGEAQVEMPKKDSYIPTVIGMAIAAIALVIGLVFPLAKVRGEELTGFEALRTLFANGLRPNFNRTGEYLNQVTLSLMYPTTVAVLFLGQILTIVSGTVRLLTKNTMYRWFLCSIFLFFMGAIALLISSTIESSIITNTVWNYIEGGLAVLGMFIGGVKIDKKL